MAVVSVTLGYRGSNNTQVMRSNYRAHEVVTSGAASVQSTIVAQSNEIWEIACATALWVKFGANATASAGNDFYIPAGVPRNFEAFIGDEVAVIDA